MTAQENTTRILRTCDEKRKTGICRDKYEGMSGRETRGDKERQCRTVLASSEEIRVVSSYRRHIGQ